MFTTNPFKRKANNHNEFDTPFAAIAALVSTLYIKPDRVDIPIARIKEFHPTDSSGRTLMMASENRIRTTYVYLNDGSTISDIVHCMINQIQGEAKNEQIWIDEKVKRWLDSPPEIAEA
jgi:hypothetical protein